MQFDESERERRLNYLYKHKLKDVTEHQLQLLLVK